MSGPFFDGAFFDGGFFASVVAPTPFPPGGGGGGGLGYGGRRKRRRNRTYELFDEIEASLRTMVYGPEPTEEAPAIRPTDANIREALDRLSTLAKDDAELRTRAADVRQSLIEWRRQREIEDDEDEFLVMH